MSVWISVCFCATSKGCPAKRGPVAASVYGESRKFHGVVQIKMKQLHTRSAGRANWRTAFGLAAGVGFSGGGAKVWTRNMKPT